MNRLNRLALSTLLITSMGMAVYASPSLPLYAQEEEAQEEEGQGILQELGSLNSVGEGESRVLSSNWQALATDEQHTYRFDYDGDDQPISVWMNVVPADGAEFEVWTEDTLAELNTGTDDTAADDTATDDTATEVEPMGVGAPIQDGSGFTIWQGSSQGAESYYIVVNSSGAENAQYLLNITSPGLTITQTATSALTPVTPSVTSAVTSPVTSPVTSAVTSAVTSPITGSTTATGTAEVTATTVITPATGEATIVTPTVSSNIATVTTDALNVRSGPSTAFPILMTVLSGTELSVLGRNATNTWLNVEVQDGVQGWVTRLLTDYRGIAVIAATPVITPTVTDGTATETGGTEGDGADDTGTDDTGDDADDTGADDGTGTDGTDEAVLSGENVSLPDANPQEALDDDWQVLNGGETRWYTFQHQGGELPVHIWMDVEPFEGAGFRILSEENAQAVMAGTAPDDVENIGRGTPNPDEGGYLFWRGVFEEAGSFYVMVEQFDDGQTLYSIHAAGPGLGRPAPTE